MSQRIINIAIILLLGLGNTYAQNSEQISIGSKHLIQSEILSEGREYWISLPTSYKQKEISYKKYPILILLDGKVHFHAVSGMVNHRSSGNTDKREIPEMIVVALLNVNRERDFTPDKIITKRENKTGGGDKFLAFIEKELIPQIERDYRTVPYRILVGHSLGGLITIHAYMQESTFFNSFIAIDPSFGTWDNDKMDNKIVDLSEDVLGRPLFIATANWGKRNLRNRDRHIRFYEAINSRFQKEFNAKQFYYEDKNHSSVPLPAIYDGLSYIFKGYNQSFREVKSVSVLTNIFEKLSIRNSFKFHPPEELVNRIGYNFLRSSNLEEKKKSLEFFILNSKNYPESFNVFDSLGDAQFQLGFEEEAINSFKKSLELNPGNKNAEIMIEKTKN